MKYDIIIVGAGLIGSAMACSLADTDYRIAIIDKSPAPTPPNEDGFEPRINAYNLATEQLLATIGIWQGLPAHRLFAFDKVEVRAEGGNGVVRFSASDLKQTHLGHFVENDLVVYHLSQRIAQSPNIDYFPSVEISDIQSQDEQLQLVTNDQQNFSTRLLLASDGANSPIRSLMAIDSHCKDYHQKCLVGTIHFDGDLNATAWQRFLSTGPLGLLPLATGYCSLAWSCHHAYADQLIAMSDTQFMDALSQATQGRLGNILGVSNRCSFPLIAKHAQRYTAARTALIGDAAHSIHPLAGLGANLGFQDVAVISKLLRQAQDSGQDIGDSALLHRYQQQRRYHNSMIMFGMTAFNTLFSNQNFILNKARHFGMNIADQLPVIKRQLVKQAMWMSFL